MLDQRRIRLADAVQMLYKCFVFAGNSSWSGIAYSLLRLQADTNPMSCKCWATIAGATQYPFNPIQYIMLPVHACWWYGPVALNQSWINVDQLSVTLAHIKRGPTLAQHWINVSCFTTSMIEIAGVK